MCSFKLPVCLINETNCTSLNAMAGFGLFCIRREIFKIMMIEVLRYPKTSKMAKITFVGDEHDEVLP